MSKQLELAIQELTRGDRPQCLYCGALVSGSGKGDHFPKPKNVGGTITVPCCVSCHDMKDRFTLDHWPMDWIEKVFMDFPKLSRETRIFLAKSIRLFAEAQHRREQTATSAETEDAG